MLKQRKYNIEETNLALFGSDLEKKVKAASAATEKAWVGAGREPGLQIWRIEKFKVVPVQAKDYGRFYDGDSYIVLKTTKKKDSDKLLWDIHFWLGDETTQDEAGTAAYKTVELDTLLGGEPVQHREVQGFESQLFLSYFQPGPIIQHGGIASGFRHVKPEEYRPRLLHIKGRKYVRVREVPMTTESLNSGDIFILDLGMKIIQWNGSKAGVTEKSKATILTRSLDDERGGKPQVVVLEEKDRDRDFWDKLGGYKEVAATGEPDDQVTGEKRLLRLSDASGKMQFSEVASGRVLKTQFDTNDVFVFDAGHEVFVWIGKGASANERKQGLGYAQSYLKDHSRPSVTPISRVLEGGENDAFRACLDR